MGLKRSLRGGLLCCRRAAGWEGLCIIGEVDDTWVEWIVDMTASVFQSGRRTQGADSRGERRDALVMQA